jgi:hypothetical protein
LIYKKNFYITKYGFYNKSKMMVCMDSEKCVVCDGDIEQKYLPMEEWGIDGYLCSKCYSKKLSEFYPGDHVRVDLSE